MNNIPEFLLEKLKKQYSDNEIENIIKGYNIKRALTLRVNTIKSNAQKIKEELAKNNIEFETVEWSKEAIIIKNASKSQIEEMEIYKNGEIYLQSLSSMLPPIIMEPKEGQDILDMAAAPGGKTTQIAAITNNMANITACELNSIRIEKLKYNIEKQGASSVFIMKKDSRQIDDFFSFDNILLDAPCSGSGTLDLSDENTFKYFTPKLIEKSIKAQTELLRKALKVLKKNKEMVYSTCSILQCENEDVVNKVLKEFNAEVVPIDIKGLEELPLLPSKIQGTICVCPNELYEGFFIAKIIKK
jgi:NOL1/NOP2/sun family putative RNA methylase